MNDGWSFVPLLVGIMLILRGFGAWNIANLGGLRLFAVLPDKNTGFFIGGSVVAFVSGELAVRRVRLGC